MMPRPAFNTIEPLHTHWLLAAAALNLSPCLLCAPRAQKVAADIAAGSLAGLDGSGEAFKTLARGMARLLRDKVAGVFSAALRLLRELVAAQVGAGQEGAGWLWSCLLCS